MHQESSGHNHCKEAGVEKVLQSHLGHFMLQAHLRVGSKLEAVLSRAKLNSIAQSAKKRAAVGDISGAVKGAMHETAILLVGYARPQVPIDPRRAWGLSLFFFGSSGIALMGVYRCW